MRSRIGVWVCLIAWVVQPALAQEVINLEDTIQGNQDQPRVLYIVPWQLDDDTAKLDGDFEQLLGELFDTIDRESFIRESQYHQRLKERNLSQQDEPVVQ